MENHAFFSLLVLYASLLLDLYFWSKSCILYSNFYGSFHSLAKLTATEKSRYGISAARGQKLRKILIRKLQKILPPKIQFFGRKNPGFYHFCHSQYDDFHRDIITKFSCYTVMCLLPTMQSHYDYHLRQK